MRTECERLTEETERKGRLESIYGASATRKRLFILVTFAALFITVLVSVSLGAVDIPFADTIRVFVQALLPGTRAPTQDYYTNIILNARLSRVLLCIACGFSLAMAGAVMQNILRNPLVSPFTLGLSSAASFGAAMAIVFGAGITGSVMVLGHEMFYKSFFTAGMAFLASLGSVAIVIVLSRRRDISRSTIILTGVIISYLFQAGVSAAKYFSDDDALREITLWLMGGMWDASWGVVYIVMVAVPLCAIAIEIYSMKVNVLSAGDEVAMNLGINVQKLRTVMLLLCTVMTSVCIAFTGIIGFVGLVAPHVTRMFIGNDSRYLFPAAGLAGALILLISDTVGRMIIRPEEIPVGIIMYIIGGIFFIWMVTRKKKEVTM